MTLRRFTAALAISTLAAACAADDPTPDQLLSVDEADLTSAELPADLAAAAAIPLTDQDLTDGAAMRFAADSTLPADGEVDITLMDAPGQDAIVAIRWGYFPPQASELWVDWSGFVAISHGRIDVIRPLRFEDDGDAPLRPFEDFLLPDASDGARIVRFRSHTRPAWDGVLLRVRRPSAGTPSVLVIHVGGTTRVLPFEELHDLEAAEPIGDAGHELRVRARSERPDGLACATTVARAGGEWQPSTTDMGGEFRGLIDLSTGPTGERLRFGGRTVDIRGPYGLFRGQVRDGGEPVAGLRGFYAAFHYSPGGMLVGKIRSRDGDHRGALVGQYEAGQFRARLLHRDPDCAPPAAD